MTTTTLNSSPLARCMMPIRTAETAPSLPWGDLGRLQTGIGHRRPSARYRRARTHKQADFVGLDAVGHGLLDDLADRLRFRIRRIEQLITGTGPLKTETVPSRSSSRPSTSAKTPGNSRSAFSRI